MGGHYGSVHVRTEDASAVRKALDELSCELKSKFLLAPPIDGWVTVFPEGNGQDFRISKQLAEKVHAPLLHCLVHDDDVFAYQFYENGKLTGEFNSCPDYFGGEPAPRGGDVQTLKSILPDAQKQSALKIVLDAERFDFEMERFDQVAAILNLPNAVTAYEYLQDGERDGIKLWKQFVHIPDLTAERDSKRAAKAKAKAEMKRLADEGILIVEKIGAKTGRRLFHESAHWCVEPTTGKILLMWSGNPMGAASPAALFWVNPKTGEQEPASVSFTSKVYQMAVSPDGQWFAAGCAARDWRVELVNLQSGQRVEFPQNRAATALCFAANGKTFFSVSEKNISVVSGPGWRNVETIELEDFCNGLAVHPGGEYLVANIQGMTTIYHIPTRTRKKMLWIEARAGTGRDLLERLAPDASESFLKTLEPHLSGDAMEKQRLRMQRHFLPKQNPFVMQFSSDGKLFICGTNEGLCVFDWDSVLAAPDMTPLTAKYFVEAEAWPMEGSRLTTGHKLVYSVVHDAVRERILFAGLEGKVCFLDLATSLSGDLLVPPVRRPFVVLQLTLDRAALVGTAVHLTIKKSDQEPCKFQIWNYPALCKQAGILF